MQNMQTLVSGSTTFGQLYALLNNNMTTLASQFSGSTFPANPTTGQPCYRTDKNPPVWYIFNGTTWEDGAMASAIVTALLAETQKARGTAATLDARLDVALNADGTLKAPTPAGGWWTQETGAIARVSASIFSVAGDRRQIYTALRAVRLAQNTDADSHVVSCSYAAESDLTIVTIDDSVVDVGITTVFYGIDVASTPDFSSNADLTQVKAITDLVTDVPTAGGIPKADSTGKISDEWINIPAGKTIGELFPYTGIDVPAGSLPADGTTYTGFNTTYSDAYTWVTTKAKTKTLTEYTAIVNQYGECGFWGLDTATGTVRVPMIKSFIQCTTSVDDISKNVEAGLPNATGALHFAINDGTNKMGVVSQSSSGIFSASGEYNKRYPQPLGGGGAYSSAEFSLAADEPIYGNSTTVQPPSIKYRWFVQIYSSVLPASTADMANWNTQLDGRANTSLSNVSSNIHFVTDSWVSSDKSSWYRKWNDGWIEQGGSGSIGETQTVTVSLMLTMKTDTYYASIINTSGKTDHDTEGVMCVSTKTTTTVKFSCGFINPDPSPYNWMICGY